MSSGETHAVVEEAEAFLAEHWSADVDRRGWRELVVDERWAALRWPHEWYGRDLDDEPAEAVEAAFARAGAPGPGAGGCCRPPHLRARRDGRDAAPRRRRRGSDGRGPRPDPGAGHLAGPPRPGGRQGRRPDHPPAAGPPTRHAHGQRLERPAGKGGGRGRRIVAARLAGQARHVRDANYSQLNAYFTSIGGGTDQIQRNIVGERILGLPREPEVDRGMPFKDVTRSS